MGHVEASVRGNWRYYWVLLKGNQNYSQSNMIHASLNFPKRNCLCYDDSILGFHWLHRVFLFLTALGRVCPERREVSRQRPT